MMIEHDQRQATEQEPSGRDRERSCTPKYRYPTKIAARHALRKWRRQGNLTSQHHVYCCQFCGGYHLGRYPLRASIY